MNKKIFLFLIIFFILSSLLPFIVSSRNPIFLSFSYMSFMIGLGLIFDFFTFQISGNSFILSKKLLQNLKLLLIVSVIVTLIMEISGNWIGNFWYFPYYSVKDYFLLIFPNFFTYTFLMMESFWIFKTLTGNLIGNTEFAKLNKKGLLVKIAKVFSGFWIISLITLLIAFFIQDYPQPLILTINNIFPNRTPFGIFLIFAISLWLFFEGKSFIRGNDTIFFAILNGSYVNLLSVLLASLTTSILFESYNLYFDLWVYENVPLVKASIFGLPLSVILAWPLQYLALIPLYSFFTKKS